MASFLFCVLCLSGVDLCTVKVATNRQLDEGIIQCIVAVLIRMESFASVTRALRITT